MKPRLNAVANRLVSELFPQKIVDDKAETCEEIADKTGQSIWMIRRTVKDNPKIEQVWKRVGRQFVPAYRVKK